jgi:hypothetical protein
MKTLNELKTQIALAKKQLEDAEAELFDFESKAENNVFESLEVALREVEEILEQRAYQDCQGAHNVGCDEYRQEFIVDGVIYKGTLTCEYNRHDKTYYYLEESEFTYEKV